MDAEMRLQIDVSHMILEVADEQQELTRGDFQARADVVARNIIKLVRDTKAECPPTIRRTRGYHFPFWRSTRARETGDRRDDG
jgi:hypothetical protein